MWLGNVHSQRAAWAREKGKKKENEWKEDVDSSKSITQGFTLGMHQWQQEKGKEREEKLTVPNGTSLLPSCEHSGQRRAARVREKHLQFQRKCSLSLQLNEKEYFKCEANDQISSEKIT